VRLLRYSINITMDGCCDDRAISADEEIHHYATATIAQAGVLLFGRVAYELINDYEVVVHPWNAGLASIST